MSLLVISLYELKQFLQIIMWIAIPATVVTILVTTILHYRRKKQIEMEGPSHPVADLPAGGMDLADSGDAYQNMLNLQKKYITEIELSHQEHFQLKEEFKKLEKQYIELIAKNGTHSRSNFASPVFQDAFQQKENEVLQLKASLLQLEETLRSEREQRNAHSSEINKLGNLLKDMEMAATKVRQESEDQDQSFGQRVEETRDKHAAEKKEWMANLDRLNQDLLKQKDENSRLRNNLIDQESAHDVIEEKNIQIGFLQNQLDNRIKNYHQLEYQSREDENRLKDLQSFTASLEREAGSIKEELQLKSEEAVHLQGKATALEERMITALQEHSALTQTLQSKTSYIEYVENSLKDLEDRNSHTLEQLNNTQISIHQLNEKLMKETQRSIELEHKLEFSSQLLMKIYQELATSLGAPAEQGRPEESLPADKKSKELEYEEPPSLEFEFINEDTAQLQN